MISRNIFLLLVAIGGFALVVSRSSRDIQAASSPLGPGSPSAANEKLEEAVRSMFAQDEQVRNAGLRVQADITKNEVTLSGTVESEAVRSRAVELAKTAHAGVVVNDRIIIKPGGSKPR
jgi:osmotically-inducible protein OsmY